MKSAKTATIKLEAMTPEQEQRMIAYREEIRAHGLSCEPMDRPTVERVITSFYARINKPKPAILYCQSPWQAMVTISLLQQTNLWANLRDNLEDNLWANLRDNLMDNLWDNLWANLWANLRDNLMDNLRDNLWANLEDNLKTAYVYTYFWGQMDLAWIAFYLFPHNQLKPMHPQPQLELLLEWEALGKSCGWWWAYENIVFVSDRPVFIGQDQEHRLHCEDGMAIRYRDGYGLYSWHGVSVPAEVIEHPETITVQQIDAEENAEVRRVMIERYGTARYIQDSGSVLLHQDRFGKLYKKEVGEDEPILMVQLLNSTPEPDGDMTYQAAVEAFGKAHTDDVVAKHLALAGSAGLDDFSSLRFKGYWLRVPPTITRAKEAVAWSFNIPEKDYCPALES